MDSNLAVEAQHSVQTKAESGSKARVLVTAGLVAVLGCSLFLFRIDHPNVWLWDESYYVQIAQTLLNGTLAPLPQNFSVEKTMGRQHPPLGPYLIAAGIKVAGDNPVGWRIAGVLAGTVCVVAIYLWTYLLLHDFSLALLAACLALLNNFLYVIARVAMVDIFLFTFAILGVLAFTAAVELDTTRSWRRLFVAASGVFFGLALASKWNAIDTIGAIAVASIVFLFAGRKIQDSDPHIQRVSENLREIGLPMLGLSLVAIPVLTYIAVFVPIMIASQTPVSPTEFIRLHLLMLKLTKAAPGNPTLYAPWYTWLFRHTPVRGFSWLLGNPAVMWGGVLAVVVCLRRLLRRFSVPEGMVLCLYGANLLQWVVTPIKVPNYYYYFPAAMFLAPAVAIALKAPAPRRLFGIRVSVVVLLAAAAVFLYCYPRMAYLESPWDCMFGCWE